MPGDEAIWSGDEETEIRGTTASDRGKLFDVMGTWKSWLCLGKNDEESSLLYFLIRRCVNYWETMLTAKLENRIEQISLEIYMIKCIVDNTERGKTCQRKTRNHNNKRRLTSHACYITVFIVTIMFTHTCTGVGEKHNIFHTLLIFSTNCVLRKKNVLNSILEPEYQQT